MVKGINVGEKCWVCNASVMFYSGVLRVGKAFLRSEDNRGIALCQLECTGKTIPFLVKGEIFNSLDEIIELYGEDYEYYQ